MFYKRALRFLGNASDAEDAVQDALLSAYRHLGQFRGQAQLSTWLMTIVTNSALMQLRRRHNGYFSLDQEQGEEGLTFSERLPDSKPSPEEICSTVEARNRLPTRLDGRSPAGSNEFDEPSALGSTHVANDDEGCSAPVALAQIQKELFSWRSGGATSEASLPLPPSVHRV